MGVGVEGQPRGERQVIKERAPIFRGINRVIVASKNDRKIRAIMSWVYKYGSVCGEQLSIPVSNHMIEGEEPDWANPIKVAQHKVMSVVEALVGRDGPKSMVVASDVVVSIQGEGEEMVPYHNLSRERELSGKELRAEKYKLQQRFSRPCRVNWDAAFALSTPDFRVVTGACHAVQFGPIPAYKFEPFFETDQVGVLLGRATQVPLIDDERFTQHVLTSSSTSFRRIADADMFELNEVLRRIEHEYYDSKNTDHLARIRDEVLGGVPTGECMDNLLGVNVRRMPRGNDAQGWILI